MLGRTARSRRPFFQTGFIVTRAPDDGEAAGDFDHHIEDANAFPD